jgi:phage terminase small subunit
MNLTPKQETFCLEYLKTGNASEAYRIAYPSQKAKPATVNRSAKELLDNPKIHARLEELRKPAIKKAQMTLEDHLEDLRILRNRATKEGKLDAAIRAEIARGKHSGVAAPEKIAPVNPDGTPYQPATPISTEAAKAVSDALDKAY